MSNITTLSFSALRQKISLIPGLLLTSIIALLVHRLINISWPIGLGLGSLTIAIFIGIVLGKTLYPSLQRLCEPGITWAKHHLLRIGIVFYGFRITWQQIWGIGYSALLIDIIVLASTFALTLWLNKRFFRIDTTIAILLGAGNSICGAAAIMATSPVVKAKSEQVSVAISCVVIFGTLATFLYPMIYHWLSVFPTFSPQDKAFGIYAGSTLHEIAQVVAVGQGISEETEATAVIAKMVRVLCLAPFLLILSAFLNHQKNEKTPNTAMAVPWFALFFIITTLINSVEIIPQPISPFLTSLSSVCLTTAMVALGLTTRIKAMYQAGVKPLLFASVLFIWLTVGGAFINIVMPLLLDKIY